MQMRHVYNYEILSDVGLQLMILAQPLTHLQLGIVICEIEMDLVFKGNLVNPLRAMSLRKKKC